MFHKSLIILLMLTVFSQVNSQPHNRYDPFDWILYRQIGQITSITEGFAYIYIGTESGGVVRIQKIGYYLEEPLGSQRETIFIQVIAVKVIGILIIWMNGVCQIKLKLYEWDLHRIMYGSKLEVGI